MRPITRLLPTVTCLLLLTQQAAAQTATLSDLRPSSAVVTNETDEVALQVIEDVFVSLSGTNAVLRASITNEAAIRAAGGEATAFFGDLSVFDVAKKMVDFTVETYGSIDIVVNVAGGFGFGQAFAVTGVVLAAVAVVILAREQARRTPAPPVRG